MGIAAAQGFSWSAVADLIRGAGEAIKAEAAQAVARAAQAAAAEAGPMYPVRTGQLRGGVTAAQESRFRWKVKQAHRYANYVEGVPKGIRTTAQGRARGRMTQTPVMGVVGPKWRRQMWQDLEAIAAKARTIDG